MCCVNVACSNKYPPLFVLMNTNCGHWAPRSHTEALKQRNQFKTTQPAAAGQTLTVLVAKLKLENIIEFIKGLHTFYIFTQYSVSKGSLNKLYLSVFLYKGLSSFPYLDLVSIKVLWKELFTLFLSEATKHIALSILTFISKY